MIRDEGNSTALSKAPRGKRLLVMLPEAPDEELKKFVRKWGKKGYVPPRPS